MTICRKCRSAEAGPRSKIHCDYCAGRHAGRMAYAMKRKRAANPDYREDERKKVLARMTKARAAKRKNGLDQHGKPFKSEKRAAWAGRLSEAKRGQPFTGGCNVRAL